MPKTDDVMCFLYSIYGSLVRLYPYSTVLAQGYLSVVNVLLNINKSQLSCFLRKIMLPKLNMFDNFLHCISLSCCFLAQNISV